MKTARISFKMLFVLGCVVLVGILSAHTVFGDDHKGKKSGKHPRYQTAPLPESYKAACGACHMPYGAFLLPAASWKAILADLGNHFSSPVELDAAAHAGVSSYLLANAADTGGTKIGGKIMRGNSGVPLRISELAYIQHKHRKVPPSEFTKASVGGLRNCIACHSGAEAGDFDDDRVRIPR